MSVLVDSTSAHNPITSVFRLPSKVDSALNDTERDLLISSSSTSSSSAEIVNDKCFHDDGDQDDHYPDETDEDGEEKYYESNKKNYDQYNSSILARLMNAIKFNSAHLKGQHNLQVNNNLTLFQHNWLSRNGLAREENSTDYNQLDYHQTQEVDDDFIFKRSYSNESTATCSNYRKTPSQLPLKHSRRHKRPWLGAGSCLKFMIGLLLFIVSLFLILKMTLLIYEQKLFLNSNQFANTSEKHHSIDGNGSKTSDDHDYLGDDEVNKSQGNTERWVVSSSKCHIPAIEPWHESIKEFVKTKEPIDCLLELKKLREKEPALADVLVPAKTYVHNNRLYFTKEAISEGFLEDGQCCFNVIKRSDENDNEIIVDQECHKIESNGLLVPYEIIGIQCTVQNKNKRISKKTKRDQQQEVEVETSTLKPQSSESMQEATTTIAPTTTTSEPSIATTPAGDDKTVDKQEDKSSSGNKTSQYIKYKNIHSFIVPKPDELTVLNKAASRNLNFNQYYNVLMVGLDTMSNLNGHRQLASTMELLKKKFNTIEYKGYNKVGENTFPNLIPLLTGLKSEQLVETKCWLASNYSDASESGDDYLDNCKYLWTFYQEFGYMTYFSEDWPAASTFNYLKPGFKHEPTAYYGRPITLARKENLNNFTSTGMSCNPCILGQPVIEIDLNHLKSFVQAYQARPYFAFQWVNCPQHDELNAGSQVDKIVEKFFDDIYHITQQQRTFVIFFSDHGWRWDDFVSTRVGHYESSLPLLTIAPPKKFIEEQPELYERMLKHQSTLLTPFDLFKTLIDLRNLAKKPIDQQILAPITNFFTLAPPVLPTTTFFNGFNPFMNILNYQQALNPNRLIKKSATSNKATTSSPVIKANITVEPGTNIETDVTTSAPVKNDVSTTPKPTVENSTTTTKESEESNPSSTATFTQLKPQDGTNYKQTFKVISLFDKHSSNREFRNATDRSCIEAGIPDNYCVCHEFREVDAKSLDILGASYYFVYVHLYERILDGAKICAPLDLKLVRSAQRYDFSNMKAKASRNRRRRAAINKTTESANSTTSSPQIKVPSTSAKTPAPSSNQTELTIDERHFLPNREYNIKVVTKPGDGMFQEVLRFYGDDLDACEKEVAKIQTVIDNSKVIVSKKHEAVMAMNEKCKFSIHNDSISRLNLYKLQSKCVVNNIELKKVCYCKDLLVEKHPKMAAQNKTVSL